MNKILKYSLSLAFVALVPLSSMAQQLPGKHPAYLHALTDLRTARWFLYHQPGSTRVYANEDMGIVEIDAAISEIKRAAVDDGKDINDYKNVDVKEHGSRLLKSIETLKKARADISSEEDNPEVRGLRDRARMHIDRAISAAERAHIEWLKDMDK
ncbi:hypothetical protein [Undibacterium sp. TJN19]|uniref:hypothetical protein n=1 Tax=Undibacterium sp. TJN19 TaxID=3413055 RepID=UPI003BF05E3A